MLFPFGIPKVKKIANLARSKKMLQNASFLAIVAVDTAENEPPKVVLLAAICCNVWRGALG